MDRMLVQLGGLLLGAVPTSLMLLLLYILYTALVHNPLKKVLAERRAKTEGAVDKAYAAGLKPMEYGGSDGTAAISKAVMAALG